MQIVLGLLIPFLGTTLGASMVLFMKKQKEQKPQKFLLGFSAGVMLAASFWSLLVPAIEMFESEFLPKWFATTVGFIVGVLFPLFLDWLIAKIETNKLDGIKKRSMMMFAVTLHNIPEGMAVGVMFAAALSYGGEITIASAFALSVGIAIQNFPEGAIISLPLVCKNQNKFKSFLYGVLSGIVEPIAATITILLTNVVVPILPYMLAFAAGTMIYVIVEELIPEAQSNKGSVLSTVGVMLGFVLMMILDVALS